MRDFNKIRISVRNLVEFVLRSGHLDSRIMGINRALEGTKAHQKVQKAAPEGYIPEMAVSHTIEYQDFTLTVEGRIDGVLIDAEKVIVDEIKSTTMPLEYIDENHNPLHWAQAKCYAYILAEKYGLDNIDVQLTYSRVDTEDVKRIIKNYTHEELKAFFYDMADKYLVFARLMGDWAIKRDESIKKLQFPFAAYRKGQREFAVAVYKTIGESKKLFVQAPTGIGKTISALFPAVKAIGEGGTSKIFYLTAKTITRQVAEEAFVRMRQGGLLMRSITITAKDKICFKEERSCNPEYCEHARDYYDKINEAILDILSHENSMTREIIEQYAQKYSLCPFELSLDLSLWADAIICDYNYVFDPRVYLKRFFMHKGGDYTFLIDEAHNLVDRSREMFSAELYKKPFLDLGRMMKTKEPALSEALNQLNKYFIDLKKSFEGGYQIKPEEPKDIYPLLKGLIAESEVFFAKNDKSEGYKELLELYFNALAFLKIGELYDEKYVTYIEKERNDIKIKLFCLDPSHMLGEAIKRGKSAVFFSATLTPMSYFRYILGGGEQDYTMRLPSPFDRQNLCLMVADNISTKFKNRENSCGPITEHIKTVISQKKGNYLVFFPSYKYMQEVYHIFNEKNPDIKVLVQDTVMNEEEREAFLDQFQSDNPETLLGFAVLGGIFSEGIDLRGDRLLGAVIVGVGLPQLCTERDIILDYFNAQNHMGYEYAYMYPGMNKVLQAAGRVIRSEADRGVVLLIDERFTSGSYQKLFPKEWEENKRVRGTGEIEKQLKQFWTI